MRVKDYCLSEEVRIQPPGANAWSDPKILEAGTFVKMIDIRWVPKHIIDDEVNKHFNPDKDVFCYCSSGIVIIPRKSIREI